MSHVTCFAQVLVRGAINFERKDIKYTRVRDKKIA